MPAPSAPADPPSPYGLAAPILRCLPSASRPQSESATAPQSELSATAWLRALSILGRSKIGCPSLAQALVKRPARDQAPARAALARVRRSARPARTSCHAHSQHSALWAAPMMSPLPVGRGLELIEGRTIDCRNLENHAFRINKLASNLAEKAPWRAKKPP